MPVDDDRNGTGFSDSDSQEMSSPSQVACSAANAIRDGTSAGMGSPPPPLGVKLTCYRLLNVMTVILWAVPKAILSYKSRSIAGTTLDLLAALFGVLLYWVGLYEEKPGNNWFFQADLAPAFGHPAKYFFGGAVWTLALLCDIFVFHPFISLFLLCFCLLLARYLPDWGAAIVSIGLTLPVVIIFMGLVVRATSGRSY